MLLSLNSIFFSIKSLIGYVRAANVESGPPPWVPFGQKIHSSHIEALAAQKEREEEKEEKDEEFRNLRQDAIAALVDAALPKKNFKGSGKQVVSLFYHECSTFVIVRNTDQTYLTKPQCPTWSPSFRVFIAGFNKMIKKSSNDYQT